MANLYDYSECDEVADAMPAPPRPLSFDEALEIIDAQMPDESFTIRANVAEALSRRSRS